VSSCLVLGVSTLVAVRFHRAIRGREAAQLGATAGLALAGAPIEWVSGLSTPEVLAGTVARLAIFLGSALVVRSAFARSARVRALSSGALQWSALAIVTLTGGLLTLEHRFSEARACALAGVVYIVLALGKPTVKQLKPLGLTLAGLALTTAVVLAL
jgi:hypothetical protein